MRRAKTGSKATTRGRSTRSRCKRRRRTWEIRPTAEGQVLTGGKRMSTEIAMMATRRSRKNNNNNKPRGIFTQSWAERYNMDNPMNLKEFPRVEFWADTKWELYKEGIQQYIRRHLTTDGKDLA
jgi:hypothetical protein